MIFRYPGAKTKLLPAIMKLLQPMLSGMDEDVSEFHDVFVGGGSVLCAVAKSFKNVRLFANDLDENMAAFWRLVSEPEGTRHEMFRKLVCQVPTIKLFTKMRESGPGSDLERAYHAVFFNRTTFSGIANSGPIGGWEQVDRGAGRTYTVGCRYNPSVIVKGFDTLVRLMSGRLTVRSEHVSNYLLGECGYGRTLYLDPPYYVNGSRLYPVSMLPWEHRNLSLTLMRLTSLNALPRWVLSYDICDEIRSMYRWAKTCEVDTRYSIDGVSKARDGWKSKKEFLITPQSV